MQSQASNQSLIRELILFATLPYCLTFKTSELHKSEIPWVKLSPLDPAPSTCKPDIGQTPVSIQQIIEGALCPHDLNNPSPLCDIRPKATFWVMDKPSHSRLYQSPAGASKIWVSGFLSQGGCQVSPHNDYLKTSEQQCSRLQRGLTKQSFFT